MRVETHTNVPIIKGIGLKGNLVVYENWISFCQQIKTAHARNKVVYRSRFFSARITKDNGFSITCHVTADEITKETTKKKVVQQFIQMMTALENAIS